MTHEPSWDDIFSGAPSSGDAPKPEHVDINRPGPSRRELREAEAQQGAAPSRKSPKPRPKRRWGWLIGLLVFCLLYTSPSPRDRQKSRMPSSA